MLVVGVFSVLCELQGHCNQHLCQVELQCVNLTRLQSRIGITI